MPYASALQAVGESVSKPLLYYENNIGGLVNLLKAMKTAGIPNIGAFTQVAGCRNGVVPNPRCLLPTIVMLCCTKLSLTSCSIFVQRDGLRQWHAAFH